MNDQYKEFKGRLRKLDEILADRGQGNTDFAQALSRVRRAERHGDRTRAPQHELVGLLERAETIARAQLAGRRSRRSAPSHRQPPSLPSNEKPSLRACGERASSRVPRRRQTLLRRDVAFLRQQLRRQDRAAGRAAHRVVREPDEAVVEDARPGGAGRW